MAHRDELIAHLDELLEPARFDDYGPNGLQVPGAEEGRMVATGVSAHLELFERAAEAGAQLVLCHHGIFWRGDALALDARRAARLRALFDADLSLAAYPLPLDAHPEVGNNALICERLGVRPTEPFGDHKGRSIGWVGRYDEPVAAADFLDRCAAAFGRAPLAFADGPDRVGSVGVVSGGGSKYLDEAIARRLDAFVTGEPSEPGMADAREAGIHFIAAGHYATETFGVRRLGELLAERFGVEHRFLEVPNPV